MTSGTAIDFAHKIHDKFMTEGMSRVEYVDYEPSESDEFKSDIAARFGFKGVPNEIIRAAVASLEMQNRVHVDRVPEEGRATAGSQGQPYPSRIFCTASLR